MEMEEMRRVVKSMSLKEHKMFLEVLEEELKFQEGSELFARAEARLARENLPDSERWI